VTRLCGKHLCRTFGGNRSGEIVSLAVLTEESPQVRELLHGFHAFSCHFHPEVVRQLNYRRHDLRAFIIGSHPPDEEAIDLQFIDREAMQVTQG